MNQGISQRFYSNLSDRLNMLQDESSLYKTIVNAPFSDRSATTLLGLGIMVLLLVNDKTGTIDRVALSDTAQAEGAVRMSAKPFRSIKIPVDNKANIIAKAIRLNQPQETDDWQYLFVPELTPQEARFNQAGAGIECSHVYPLKSKNGGALIFSFFEPLDSISQAARDFMVQYSAMVDDVLAL